MEYSEKCSLCKENHGSLETFTLRKKPHKAVKMHKVVCEDCMKPQDGETIEAYLSSYYNMEVTR